MSVKNKKFSSKIANFMVNAFVAAFAVICLIPFYLVLSVSLTDEKTLIYKGYGFFPAKFSLEAYSIILKDPSVILSSYKVTIIVTVIGTILSLLICSMIAYPMSRKDFKYRNRYAFYLFFTMLFNGGLVPWYFLCSFLQLKDNYLGLIVPALVSAYNVLILRNNFAAIPDSFHESAKVEGASEYRIFFRIILPLSKPALATIALFITLNYWNDWFTGLMLIDSSKIIPLQLRLKTLMDNIEFLNNNAKINILPQNFPSLSLRMATCIVVIGPIIFAYPFFQKYIIKGLMVGGVKG